MKKTKFPLPDLTDGQRHTITTEVAMRLVKERAYAIYIPTAFGQVRVFKWVMLEFLQEFKQATLKVRKVPKFATYFFYPD